MKILIFTEGTILMHLSGKDASREERVRQSKAEGIQREDRKIAFETDSPMPVAPKGSVYDLESYVPIDNAVNKISSWEKQGALVCYLTSRRIKTEIETIKSILEKYNFPNASDIYYRMQGEDYKNVVERIMPDIIIDDDCESIGGEVEMIYTHLKPELKAKIKSITVKEFGGIDHLPDEISVLRK